MYLSGHLICRSCIYNFPKNKQIIAILNKSFMTIVAKLFIFSFTVPVILNKIHCHWSNLHLSLLIVSPISTKYQTFFFFSQTRRYAEPLCPKTYSFKCLKKPLRIYHTQIVKEHFVNTLFFVLLLKHFTHTHALLLYTYKYILFLPWIIKKNNH